MNNTSKLLELATQKFGKLNETEKALLHAVTKGEIADYSTELEKDNNPPEAVKCGKERVISSDFLVWLCSDLEARTLVTRHGILVRGARIDEELDLSNTIIPFSLYFIECTFLKGINLQSAKIHNLYLTGTNTGSISAGGLNVEGSVYMNKDFRADGSVRLTGAIINGDIVCDGGKFINREGEAFSADRVKVDGSIFFRESFKAEGEVRLLHATIGRTFECDQGEFINNGARALVFEGTKVNGNVHIRDGFKAQGEVCLNGAIIGGDLACRCGKFLNNGKETLIANKVIVQGDVFLDGHFETDGKVILAGATIGGDVKCDSGQFTKLDLRRTTITGNLECPNSKFSNKGRYALMGEMLIVKGSIFLISGFESEGEINLTSATIGGGLVCDGGQFLNADGCAINAEGSNIKHGISMCNINQGILCKRFMVEGEVSLSGAQVGGNLSCNGFLTNKGGYVFTSPRMTVEGDVFLIEGFEAEGEVNLIGTKIGGQLNCQGAKFLNEKSRALVADLVTVGGNVFLSNGFKAKGEVRLIHAKIGGQLICNEGHFINTDGYALNGEKMRVDGDVFMQDSFEAKGKISLIHATLGSLKWGDIISLPKVILDLRSARIGKLCDGLENWPESGRLFLNGLVYDEICDCSTKDANTRIEWIRRQGHHEFHPQPYEQLAAVLQKNGYENDAKKVLIAKNNDYVRIKRPRSFEKINCYLLKLTIGYGYRPWRTLWWIFAFVILGTALFGIGFKKGLVVPIDATGHISEFNPLAYSFDAFVPLVDLYQESFWLPDATLEFQYRISKDSAIPIKGSHLRIYLWIHIFAGWILTTLLIAGLTGLVKK